MLFGGLKGPRAPEDPDMVVSRITHFIKPFLFHFSVEVDQLEVWVALFGGLKAQRAPDDLDMVVSKITHFIYLFLFYFSVKVI